VDRGGKQVVGRELVVAFRVLVGNIEEKNAVLELSARADALGEFQVLLIELLEGLADVGKGGNLFERLGKQLWNQTGHKAFGARALDDQGKLGGRVAHLDRGLYVRVLGAVDHVCPVDQFLEVGSCEAELRRADVRQELRAGTEFRSVKLPAARVAAEVFGVSRSEERALVMIEPPRQAVGAGILEVDDGVLIAVENIRLEKLAGPVHQAAVTELRLGVDRGPIKTGEESRGAGAVKALVMETHSDS